MPKVSIIIPVYNTSEYLEKCIQSLISQTLNDIEMIFIDDGSEDNSLDILNSYAQQDSRIKVLMQKHQKQGAARNKGMKIAKGEYIAFVDSDDWVEKDMFEKMYNRAFSTNSDITVCSMNSYNEQTKSFFISTYNTLDVFGDKFFHETFSPKVTYDYVFQIPVSPCNKIIKREFLIKNNIFFPENIYFEDNPFFFNAWFSANKITLVNEKLYNYRVASKTSTCTGADSKKLYIFNVLKQTERLLKKKQIYNALKSNYLTYKYWTFIYWYNKIQNKSVKLKFFIYLLFEMPSVAFLQISLMLKSKKLKMLLSLNKNKKILFWGASNFLNKYINTIDLSNNILGIIDRNTSKWNSAVNGLKIYAPNSINELQPDIIIITIVNFGKASKKEIENYLKESKLSNCKLYLL